MDEPREPGPGREFVVRDHPFLPGEPATVETPGAADQSPAGRPFRHRPLPNGSRRGRPSHEPRLPRSLQHRPSGRAPPDRAALPPDPPPLEHPRLFGDPPDPDRDLVEPGNLQHQGKPKPRGNHPHRVWFAGTTPDPRDRGQQLHVGAASDGTRKPLFEPRGHQFSLHEPDRGPPRRVVRPGGAGAHQPHAKRSVGGDGPPRVLGADQPPLPGPPRNGPDGGGPGGGMRPREPRGVLCGLLQEKRQDPRQDRVSLLRVVPRLVSVARFGSNPIDSNRRDSHGHRHAPRGELGQNFVFKRRTGTGSKTNRAAIGFRWPDCKRLINI
mmetsp:Transcript_20235/g.42047  ORF Transcript_20235/g.42047 Transcript_20235/m.42047 type:complete len:325 (-) Transcript_20235:30-1004(-)